MMHAMIFVLKGRQKLARFNAREFATLIIDILSDARRRQYGVQKSSTIHVSSPTERTLREMHHHHTNSSLSDDEPLYDSVASDEDYASIGDNQSLKEDDLKALDGKKEVGHFSHDLQCYLSGCLLKTFTQFPYLCFLSEVHSKNM
jgi:hypothetical protein